MAIDLFCYTSCELAKTEATLRAIAAHNQEMFFDKFVISTARQANAIQKEMASEYGIDAQSIFLIRLNDKGAAGLEPEIVAILKGEFGLHDVAVLWENERLL
jgi:hypothetical protein